MRSSETRISPTLGLGLIMSGAMLFAVAAACAIAAVEHMAAAAVLCGPVARHCVLCVASAGSLLASTGVIAAGVMLLKDRPSPGRARAKVSRPR